MKRLTRLTIALLICGILAATPAYARQTKPKNPSEMTKSEAELNGYSEEKWQALKDNKLEYDEIKDIVHNFNPTMAEYWDSYDDSVRSVEFSADIMREAKKEATDTYNQYKNNPYLDAMTKAQLKSLVTVAATMFKQYNTTYQSLKRGGSASKQLKSAEDRLVNAVEQMMIGYKTAEINVEMLKKLVELNEASLKAYEDMYREGTATETDVLNAKAGLLSSKSNLASLEARTKQLYEQLITMCGWNADENIKIGDIPETDKARIDAMSPETDFAKAEGNNTTLISLRQSSRKKNEGALKAQDEYYDAKAGELRVKLDTLYAAVIAAQYAYEGAKAGYEGAKIQEEAIAKQYASGMLSKAQHIGAKIQVLQKAAGLVTARNSLEQAVRNYEWALKGYCDIEQNSGKS